MISHILEIDLTFCANTFGNTPCTASNASGFECYNTKRTCQDAPNFSVSSKTFRFSEQRNDPVKGAYPAIVRISTAPTELDRKEGLKHTGAIKIDLADFADNDIDNDPYVSTRPYIATDQGTFWGKLHARNPHHYARTARLIAYDNGVTVETFHLVVEQITNPNRDGLVSVTLRDPLFLTDGDNSLAPKPSKGSLVADISAGAGSFEFDDGTEYPASGVVAMGRERLRYTRTGNNATITERGAFGTEAQSHRAGAKIQLCLVFDNVPLHEIYREFIRDYTPIDESLIPFADWTQEFNDWLQPYTLSHCLSKPEPVRDHFSRLQEQTGTFIFWSQRDAEIKLYSNVRETQNSITTTLSDEYNFKRNGEITMEPEPKERVSQVFINFGIINYSDSFDDEDNFENYEFRSDLDSEGLDEYGTEAIRIINADWLDSSSQAGQIASRILSQFGATPQTASFSLSRIDKGLSTGGHFFIDTVALQSPSGVRLPAEMEMLSMRYMPADMSYECKAQTFSFLVGQLFAFIAPDGTPDHDNASPAEKQQYGFIAQDDGKMPDGTDAYLII